MMGRLDVPNGSTWVNSSEGCIRCVSKMLIAKEHSEFQNSENSAGQK